MSQKLVKSLHEEEDALFEKIIGVHVLLAKYEAAPKYSISLAKDSDVPRGKSPSYSKNEGGLPDINSLTGLVFAAIEKSEGTVDEITSAIAPLRPKQDFKSLRKQVRNICYKLWYRSKLINKKGQGIDIIYSKK